jgi:hypothetical protein
MKAIRNTLLRAIFIFVLALTSMRGFSQVAEESNDSLMAAKLMQDNIELYSQIDSLRNLVQQSQAANRTDDRVVDSLQTLVMQFQAQLTVSGTHTDTLESQRLRLAQRLVIVKEEMLLLNTALESKLQELREKEYKLSDCEIRLREAQAAASLNQVRLEGKIDVNTTKVEAKDREIAYMQETIKEKDRIISEKTAELAAYYREKGNSLRIVDSLSRALNAKELEFVKINERLKIIESQYNELVAQKTAAQNKKKKIRFTQGVGLKFYRTPDYQLAPESSGTTSTYVIVNKNSGNFEFDYITGVTLSLYDLTKAESKYTYDAGVFFGFGGTNLFKNFYIAPSAKVFDFFHLLVGVNIAEYQELQSGFYVGDELPPGMSIPTVKEWKANLFFGLVVDFELLTSIPKKM